MDSKTPLTPLIAFRAHAAYCYDHRYDDEPDEFGHKNADAVLLPFTLKNGGGSYEGRVFGADDEAIFVYVTGSGVFRWKYEQIELPGIYADESPATIRFAINNAPHGFGWTVRYLDIHNIWREAFTESLAAGHFDHDGITLHDAQGDIDSGIDHMYGSVDSREFSDGNVRVPYNRLISIARDPFPPSWDTVPRERPITFIDVEPDGVILGSEPYPGHKEEGDDSSLIARGRALIASSLSGQPETPNEEEATWAIASVKEMRRFEEEQLEGEFQSKLATSEDWELFDCGNVPETGLRCLHCGYEEVFSDRETAIAALDGAIECSRCIEGDPPEEGEPPFYHHDTSRGAKLDAYPLTYDGENLLELVVNSAVKTAAGLLLSTDDAATLYFALQGWLQQHDPALLHSDPMGDHMGENK